MPQEFGIPTGPFTFDVHYGDLPHADAADLSEVRLGTDPAGALWLLARTTTMTAASRRSLPAWRRGFPLARPTAIAS